MLHYDEMYLCYCYDDKYLLYHYDEILLLVSSARLRMSISWFYIRRF